MTQCKYNALYNLQNAAGKYLIALISTRRETFHSSSPVFFESVDITQMLMEYVIEAAEPLAITRQVFM